MLYLRFARPWPHALVALAAALVAGCGSDDVPANGTTTTTTTATGSGGGGGEGGSGGAGLLALAPGEVAELSAIDGAFAGRIATEGTERYLLVVGSTDFAAAKKQAGYAVAVGDAPAGATATLVSGCSLPSAPWADVPVPNDPPPTGTGPTVGDTRTVDVPLPTGAETIDVSAIAVGEHTIVWADTTAAHPAVLDPADVQEFLTDFEQIILPRARSVFGVESDVDGDGRVSLVFSPLTYQTAVAFFTECDLNDALPCPSNNHGEYLYLTPPNAIDPPYNTPNAIKEILAHELSHMLHFDHKVLANGLPSWDESMYMIEGIGGFAQDVLGYQAGNLYVTMAALDGIDDYSIGKTLADNAVYDTKNDGVLRGGSYLFVRWLYDRAGGDLANADGTIESKGGPALLQALIDSTDSMAVALPTAVGAATEDLVMDFWSTLAISNRQFETGVEPANACFAYLPVVDDPVTGRPRGADVFATFHGTQQMLGPKVQKVAEADGILRGGGIELLEVDAQPGQTELAVTVSGDAMAKARVRIARIQ